MKRLIFATSILIICIPVLAQDFGMVQNLEKRMIKYDSLNQFNGNILLTNREKIVYKQSFGLADQNKNILNNSETQFNIGSIGKMFTAIAIMQLAEKGKLNIDESINLWLSEYKLPNAEKITIKHLLTHQSGFGTYMRSRNFNSKQNYTLDELVKIIAQQSLLFNEPGKDASYSNSAFVILGRIIEKISGISWWDYFVQNIFQPAGMNNMHRYLPGESNPNKAQGYDFNAAGNFMDVTNDPMPYSDGGLYATSEDLVKFLSALQNHKLLSEASMAIMTQKYATLKAFNCEMGLGWEISKAGTIEIIAKGGNVQGFSGQIILLPGDYSLVLLSNLTTGAFDNLENIVQTIYGLETPEPRQSSANFIYNELEKRGWDKLKTELKEFVEENGYSYNPYDLVSVSMALKDEKNYQLSVVLLRYFLADHPNYRFGYYLLGEIYEQLNEKVNALESYERLVTLDPTNEEVVQRIKRLKTE